MKTMKKPLAIIVGLSLAQIPAHGQIMRHDISIQDYRDFGEGKGKFRPGREHVPVYRTTDGILDGYLAAPVPDFGANVDGGYATLQAPSYLVGVRHNGGYKTVNFGTHAKFAPTYLLINRNNYDDFYHKTGSDRKDYHAPRLNKVVVDHAPAPFVTKEQLLAGGASRYTAFAHVGTGAQNQESPDPNGKMISLAGAYKWKAGSMMSPEAMILNTMIRWKIYGPGALQSTPLSAINAAGDSGSPVFAWDNLEKEWKLVGVHLSSSSSSRYNRLSSSHYMDAQFLADLTAKNTDIDVTDSASSSDIHWKQESIEQGDESWVWHGLKGPLANQEPSKATIAQLDATKDIRFNGEGGNIILDQSVNLGAGKLQFSNNYTVQSAEGVNASWVGGGVEVDKDKTVFWKVNGLKNDAMHKIGAGTLHIQGTGINEGSLNVGDGTVILDQQADANGAKQAFSAVTLISGRPVVVLNSADQIASENIRFGYLGGILDLNGNDINFSTINHNDGGARIVNRNTEKASGITLTGTNQTFLGSFGEKDGTAHLSLTYAPDSTTDNWTLRGGANIDALNIQQGNFALGGEQTLHAGDIYFSNDWEARQYEIADINIKDDAALTLKEHASLAGNVLVGKAATLNIWDRTVLNGKVNLLGTDSQLIADIEDHTSTMGTADSLIYSDITGEGRVIKNGSGLLTLGGNISNTGGTNVTEGALQVNGNMTSALTMGNNTQLSGHGNISTLTLADNTVIAPGAQSFDAGNYSTLHVNTLNTNGTTGLVLNSGFTSDTTDRLLINGDLNTADNSPMMLSINAKDIWRDSDINHNGAADSREGISLIQVGGKSGADSIKLAGNYVARGAWAYGLYAFAPGHASAEERLVEGEGNQYWDYRLQNIMLDADGISIPVAPEPAPEPTPEPSPNPAPAPVPDPTPAPAPEPAPAPARKALIPQAPAYISLPAMMLNFDKNITSLIADTTRDSHSYFFMNGYGGGDSYHSSGNFSNYGYDFNTRYQGWVMGGRWQSDEEQKNRYALSLGVHKGNLTLKPHAVDGSSRGWFDTRGISGLLNWQDNSGLMANINVGYTQIKGSTVTDLRGKVASPRASIWNAGIEGGKTWRWDRHQVTPLIGMDYQHLDIDRFTDKDGAHVRYNTHNAPAYNAGVRYVWQSTPEGLAGVTLNNELRFRVSPGQASQTIISGGGEETIFHSGKGGNQLQLKSGIGFNATKNIAFNTQMQYQQRLQREGVSDWSVFGGVKIDF